MVLDISAKIKETGYLSPNIPTIIMNLLMGE
jgi:hypothetical protein